MIVAVVVTVILIAFPREKERITAENREVNVTVGNCITANRYLDFIKSLFICEKKNTTMI